MIIFQHVSDFYNQKSSVYLKHTLGEKFLMGLVELLWLFQTDGQKKQTDRQRKQFLAGDAPKNRQYMDLFLFITI
jgi:hypothetical protein